MKKIFIPILVIAVCAIAIIVFLLFGKEEKKPQEPNKISTSTSIKLNNKTYINSLETINIEGTNDYFIITEKVKWETPDYPEGTTVSFAFNIPYKTIINDIEYKGAYILGDNSYVVEDNNPKYNIEITNLTSNGEIEVLITKK